MGKLSENLFKTKVCHKDQYNILNTAATINLIAAVNLILRLVLIFEVENTKKLQVDTINIAANITLHSSLFINCVLMLSIHEI